MPVPQYLRPTQRPLDLQAALGGMTPSEAVFEVGRGGRFVVFQFCISLLIVTFRRNTAIRFIRAGENAAAASLPCTLLSFLFGWWGFPWGLIYTPQIISRNLQGGTDVTSAILSRLQPAPVPPSADKLASTTTIR